MERSCKKKIKERVEVEDWQKKIGYSQKPKGRRRMRRPG